VASSAQVQRQDGVLVVTRRKVPEGKPQTREIHTVLRQHLATCAQLWPSNVLLGVLLGWCLFVRCRWRSYESMQL
jgi:hypothetical protein